MREIEYRAWNKDLKIMDYGNDELLGYVEFEASPTRAVNDIINQNYPELVWMQYIGLKDKNSKKIYEGDIVRCWSGKEEDYLDYRELVGVVEYIAPYWRVGGNELAWNAEFIEVLGNIYENPEILGVIE